jgi:hypothetical protein
VGSANCVKDVNCVEKVLAMHIEVYWLSSRERVFHRAG